MFGYIDENGNYYEGDRQGNDLIVPKRPSYECELVNGEWVVTDAVLLAEIRAQRKPLLDEADIKVNIAFDNGLDMTPYKEYRQALRDITEQADLENLVWPLKPWQ